MIRFFVVMNVGGLPGAIAICRAAKTMRGARGKIFEWGLMTSPRKTIHVILPQTLKCIQFFKHRSLYNLYTCFTSSFLGPFIGWGPMQIAPPAPPPPSRQAWLFVLKLKQHGQEALLHTYCTCTCM